MAWHGEPGQTPSIYIATMGNGSSDNFTNGELAHIRKTGRLTWENKRGETVSLPTIQALHGALKAAGLDNVQRMSADSLGGSIATALMSELAPDQVTHAYLKGRTNIRNHFPLVLAWKMLIIENQVNGKKNRETTTDPWSLHRNDGAVVEAAKTRLTKVYGEKHEPAAGSKFMQLASYLVGLSKGTRRDGQPSPAALDTTVALRRQGDAKLTFDMPRDDLLYGRKAERYAERIVHDLGALALDGSAVEVVLSKGTHNGHGQYPMQRDASETYAFTRTV